MQFERVVIVGVGLLGGSIGLALLERGLARAVIGVGRRVEPLQQAQQLGAISQYETHLEQACAGADLAIVCTPVQSVAQYVSQCLSLMPPGCLVTDVGSTKHSICQDLAAPAHAQFCGSHPLAGSDKSGVLYAEAGLFDGRLTVVTPVELTAKGVVERTEQLWQALGSRTVRMSPQAHDEAIARTSHLPHLLAAALAGLTPNELLPLAASGWCDTTRVAAGNVEMWRQIVSENRAPVLAALRGFADALQDWIEALERGDDARLTQLLESGKQKRDSVGN